MSGYHGRHRYSAREASTLADYRLCEEAEDKLAELERSDWNDFANLRRLRNELVAITERLIAAMEGA